MASSSLRTSCFQCDSSTSLPFMNGWRLRTGRYAQLCNRCGSLYEQGRFCETFHSRDDGWRDCESCGKLVHCGCVASFHAYMLLDLGGITCKECTKINLMKARRQCVYSEIQIGNGTPQGDATRRVHMDSQSRPPVPGLGLQQISKVSNAVVIPLFDKLLSANDADQKLARLVVPKKCAEAFFPDISRSHGIPIKIHDTKGKAWECHFRYWPNNSSKIYILEGLKDCMVSMQWQAGDIVKFYRVEPEGKLVIGLKKPFAVPQPREESLALVGPLSSKP